MKKLALLFTLGLIVSVQTSNAQEFEAPKSGAVLEVKESTMTIAPGGEISFDVWMNRSKKARKSNFSMPTLAGSENISFLVEEDESDENHFIVTARAEAVASGKLTYILNSRSTGYHQVKGRMISFEIKNSDKLISKQDN